MADITNNVKSVLRDMLTIIQERTSFTVSGRELGQVNRVLANVEQLVAGLDEGTMQVSTVEPVVEEATDGDAE